MSLTLTDSQLSPRQISDEFVIQTHNLTKLFGNEVAVNNVTFNVLRGKIFGFIGPSGCGKTTTVRLLMGVYRPTAGEAKVLGRSPAEFTQTARAKIGYMPQLSVLYPNLSVWQNLNFFASLYGVSLRRGSRLNGLLDFVELSQHKNKLVRYTSGGMQRRLSLVAALAHNPELIFLDEPTAGIDPVLRRKFWDYFNELQHEDRTLFVTTQYVGESAYCDYVGVMSAGHLLMVDTPEALRRRAFGGEMVDLYTRERIKYRQMQLVKELPFVLSSVERLSDSGLRLVVNDAGTAAPALLEWCQSQNLGVDAIEEYFPPFDDVFVELVKEKPSG